MSTQTMEDEKDIGTRRFPTAQEMFARVRCNQILGSYCDVGCFLHAAPISRGVRLIKQCNLLIKGLRKLFRSALFLTPRCLRRRGDLNSYIIRENEKCSCFPCNHK